MLHLSYLTAYALFPLLQAGSVRSGRSVLQLLLLHPPWSVPGQKVFPLQKQPFRQQAPFFLYTHNFHPENQIISGFLHGTPAFPLRQPYPFHCAFHNSLR